MPTGTVLPWVRESRENVGLLIAALRHRHRKLKESSEKSVSNQQTFEPNCTGQLDRIESCAPPKGAVFRRVFSDCAGIDLRRRGGHFLAPYLQEASVARARLTIQNPWQFRVIFHTSGTE